MFLLANLPVTVASRRRPVVAAAAALTFGLSKRANHRQSFSHHDSRRLIPCRRPSCLSYRSLQHPGHSEEATAASDRRAAGPILSHEQSKLSFGAK